MTIGEITVTPLPPPPQMQIPELPLEPRKVNEIPNKTSELSACLLISGMVCRDNDKRLKLCRRRSPPVRVTSPFTARR